MTTRDIELNIKNQFAGKQDKHEPFRAVITDSAGNQTGTNSVWRDENRRLVYYRPLGSGAVAVALCDRIEPLIGLGVYIQFSDLIDQYEVLRDDPAQRSATSNRRSYLITVKDDLERGGQQQFWIEDEMLQNLALNPNTGLTLDIGPGDYDYFGERKSFPGEAAFDISSNQPAGPNEHRLVGLYLDSANALQAVNGTVTTNDVAASEPTWPANAFRLFTVDLDESQTTISISTDVKSRKILWGETRGGAPTEGRVVLVSGATRIDYDNISDAITDASAGDTILIGTGTFSESITINKQLQLVGIDRLATVIDQSTDDATVTITAAQARITNCYIKNSKNDAGDTQAVLIQNSLLCEIENCYIDNTNSSGNGDGIESQSLSSSTLAFVGNVRMNTVTGRGVYASDSTNVNQVYLAHCSIRGNVDDINAVSGAFVDFAFAEIPSVDIAGAGTIRGILFDTTNAALRIPANTAYIQMEERGSDPSAPTTNEWSTYFKSDGLYYIDDAGATRGPIPGAWTTFTPTVTQSGSVTVTVNYARYKLVDDLCAMQVKLSVTGSGTANNAIVIAGLPAAAQPTNIGLLGTFLVDDNGTALYQGALRASGADDLRFIVHNATGFVGVVPNFGLANGDTIWLEASYEV